METWKDIIGFEGLYQVSNLGNIKALQMQDGFYLRPESHKAKLLSNVGYHRVHLRKNKKSFYKSIHRIVAEAFIPNPENKKTVNHKNANKLDNSLENLEWTTHKENTQHAIGIGNIKTGRADRRTKTIYQFTLDRKLIREFYGFNHVKKELGFENTRICAVCNGRKDTAYKYMWSYKKAI